MKKTIEQIRTENLNLLIDKCGGVVNFAKRIDRDQSQISQWKNNSINTKTGKPRYISAASCRYIENELNKYVGWFDEDHSVNPDCIEYMDDIELSRHPDVPLYRRPSYDSMHDKGKPIRMLSCIPDDASEGTYALIVENDSLYDLERKVIIRKDDIVLIDPNKSPVDGCYVLASSSTLGLVSLKVFREQDGRHFLYTPNPDWQEKWIPIDESISLHGVVIQVIKLT